MRPAWALALLCLGRVASAAGSDAPPPADAASGAWAFEVTLDGRPIGSHRFDVEGPPEARVVHSRTEMVVRLLGIPVYRYRHSADERWGGDCLRALNSRTDDDGQVRQVDRRFDGECLMGFAYWNPRLPLQQRLIDPQTGEVEAVRINAVPDASIDVRGRPTPARGWRLVTRQQRITVWYAEDSGRWVGLDADAAGNRRLSYRLPPP